MRLVLLGPPGSGKGTQAVRLAKTLDLQHVATGDILRDEVARQTGLGAKAKAFMDAGQLVPDQLVSDMIAARLHEKFILDGYPRSLPQAESLTILLKQKGWNLDAVLNLDVPEEEIVARLGGRQVCAQCKSVFPAATTGPCPKCGGKLGKRADDNPTVIRERLAVYRDKTKPLEDYYRKAGLLNNVSGVGKPDDIFQRLQAAITKA
ncbi:adenylate kinase [Candidatus Micrarchaeota archaeon]|nr:adenylate kinase [Candidatus Micrarchaeota archaeon]